MRLDARFDANPQIAYGIAKGMGIDTEGMEPKEVWEAIKKKDPSKVSGKVSKSVKETSRGEHKATGKIVSVEDTPTVKTVGGYTRKNNFKGGYGYTDVSVKDKGTRAGYSTRKHQNDKGEWTEEREAIHSKIVDDAFEGINKAKGKPVCVFMGGGPSSGKTYVVNKMGDELNLPKDNDRVLIDPDKFKKPFPEYDPNDPELVHEESSALAKRITSIAQQNGYNTTVDGTGDGSVEKMRKKIQQAKDAGQTVKGVYVFKPVEDAIVSNFARERTVNPKMLVDTHVAISKILPEIAADFDECKLYANIKKGEPPVLIAEGGGGKPLKVLDKNLYDGFLKNGNYKYSDKRMAELKAMPEAQKKTAAPKAQKYKKIK